MSRDGVVAPAAAAGGLRVVAAAAPARPAVAGAAAAPYLQALDGVRRRQGPRLCVRDFQAVDCMDLVLDFEEAAASGPAELAGAAGSELRARWLARVVHAVRSQHGDWLEGVARCPTRRQLGAVSRMHWVVAETPAARAQLVRTAELQSLAVQVDGVDWRIPATMALGGLLAHQHQILVTGLDARCCRQGLLEALLHAAGYSAEEGVSVVHESAGRVPSVPGEDGGVAALDRAVAVVQVPSAHAGLPRLPSLIDDGYGEVHIEVRRRVVPPGLLVVRRLSAPSPPPPPPPRAQGQPAAHPGVRPEMDRVYSAAGVTQEVRAAPAQLAAEVAGRAAVPPGTRTGLGFVPASQPVAVAGSPAARAGLSGAARDAAAAPPAGDVDMDGGTGAGVEGGGAGERVGGAEAAPADALMLPALPSRDVPMDEPGFGAACQFVAECTDGVSAAQIQQIVMQARSVDPAAYSQARDAARPSELPHGFRLALYAQARAMLGESDAAALAVDWGSASGDDEMWQALSSAAAAEQAGSTPPAAGVRLAGRATAAVAAGQRDAHHAGSPPGPSSPAGAEGTSAGEAGGRRGSARLHQRPPTASTSWLGLQAASLGHLPGMGGQSSSAGRGKGRGPSHR